MTPLITLCLLLAFPQESVADRVQKFVKDLGDPELAVRDAASRKLFDMGDPAVGPLKKALEASSDAEVTARIKALLAKLETQPLDAAKEYCKTKLGGNYDPTLNYDKAGCGEVRSELAKKWLPDLVLIVAWNSRKEPSNRVIIAFDRKSKEAFELKTWDDVKKHLAPASKDEDLPEICATIAQVVGTCNLCGFVNVAANVFKVEKKEGGFHVETTWSHMAGTVEHVTCHWTLDFAADRTLTSFESKPKYQTKHE